MPAPACCVEDSIEKERMKREIASLNMQLQQAHTVVKEKTDSDPVLDSTNCLRSILREDRLI